MMTFPFPILLTALQLVGAIIFDTAVIRMRGRDKLDDHPDEHARLIQPAMLRAAIPASIVLALGKAMTYISYGKISVSLTHTVKAASPIFSVLLMRVWMNKRPSQAALIALLPICAGIILCTVTELEVCRSVHVHHVSSFFLIWCFR